MSTRYAILGLLNKKPMHGYELKKEFEQSVSSIWSINYGRLYTLLKKMEGEDVIKKETVSQDNKPNKIVYEITDKGIKELHEWLATPIIKRQAKDEFYLKMMFLSQKNKEDTIKFVDDQIKAIEEQYTELKSIKEDHGDKMEKFMKLLLEAAIMHFEVDIKWLNMYKERMDLK